VLFHELAQFFLGTSPRIHVDHPETGKQQPLAARRGFVRIYFEDANFSASTVLRVEEHTLVREVRQIMGNKMRLASKHLDHYVILVVYANRKEGSSSSMTARTLKDNELIFKVQEELHLVGLSLDDTNAPVLNKPLRQRSRQMLKFVFKVRVHDTYL
jgi:hypothetical protein